MSHNIIKKYLKLRRKDISYLKFIFEGYEGMCTQTTIDSTTAIVTLTVLPDFISETNRLLYALRAEIAFHEIEDFQRERKDDEENI